MPKSLYLAIFTAGFLSTTCQRSGNVDRRRDIPHEAQSKNLSQQEQIIAADKKTEIATKKPGALQPGSTQQIVHLSTFASPTEASPQWIAKAARTLRYGKRLSEDELRALSGQDPDAVVDYFLQDSDFLLTLLDFNLYFLGYKGDSLFDLYDSSSFDSGLIDFPNAIESVKEYAEGGDYFKFFDFRHPLYVTKLNRSKFRPQQALLDWLMLSEQQFGALKGFEPYDRLFQAVAEVLLRAKTGINSQSTAQICEEFKRPGDENLFDIVSESLSFLPQNLSTDFDSAWFDLADSCDGQNLNASQDKLGKSLEASTLALKELWRISKTIPITNDTRASLESFYGLKDWTGKSFFLANENTSLNQRFFADHQNSSTNANRRRAAYILKTYFCDRLIPIAVVSTIEHTEGGKHGSDPNCYSCHYKLDPMAGFFRSRGVLGTDFEDPATVKLLNIALEQAGMEPAAFLFDDQTALNQKQKLEYYNSWKGGTKNSGWNVGYIRSSSDLSKNSYGQSLQDLFGIIRSAPEAKQCLVQRMAEYFIGSNLTYDLGWLQAITERMNAEANSSRGVATALKLIINSYAFREQNPVEGQCYDFLDADGQTKQDLPPCEVNVILQQNCISCHNSTHPSRGLDLSVWRADAGGRNGFSHVTGNGQEFLDVCQSFEKIKERISNSDLGQVMPPGAVMPTSQKEKLYLWLDARLAACQGGLQ